MKTRRDYLLSIGFTDVTSEVIEKLSAKQTKAIQRVMARINGSEFYAVYLDRKSNTMTIHSSYLAHTYEINPIQALFGASYKSAGSIADENGNWQEWRVAPHGENSGT